MHTCLSVSICVCVCVTERERGGQRERESMCVALVPCEEGVSVYVRTRVLLITDHYACFVFV